MKKYFYRVVCWDSYTILGSHEFFVKRIRRFKQIRKIFIVIYSYAKKLVGITN